MSTTAATIENDEVLRTFLTFPPEIQPKLLALRELIFATAAATDGVGPIEETLKWGEPAYLTSKSKSGSTIRLGWKQANPDQYAIYFICHTNLVAHFRELFPNELRFDGDRAIVFEKDDPIPADAVATCLKMALTYHQRSRKQKDT